MARLRRPSPEKFPLAPAKLRNLLPPFPTHRCSCQILSIPLPSGLRYVSPLRISPLPAGYYEDTIGLGLGDPTCTPIGRSGAKRSRVPLAEAEPVEDASARCPELLATPPHISHKRRKQKASCCLCLLKLMLPSRSPPHLSHPRR